MKKQIKLKIGTVNAFALGIVLFWIIWFIDAYAWLNVFDKVDDVLRIILVVGMVLIIAATFLVICKFSISSYKPKKGNIVSIIALIVMVSVHLFIYNSLCNMGYRTFSSVNITNKQVVGDSYYFHINSTDNERIVEMKCTKEIYEALIIDPNVLYTIGYRWLKYDENKGVLETIDLKDFIDNRR